MSKIDFYIRFGVHKEREILNEMKDYISGLCIPSHILSYSQDPTVAAIKHVGKPYFIDPMTYVYASHDFPKYLAKKESKPGEKQIKFKPSIQKLTIDLNLIEHFNNTDYNPLTTDVFDEDFTRKLAQASVDLQMNKVNSGKETAYKRYSELLKIAEGKEFEGHVSEDISPKFVVSPYFFFSTANDPWLSVNVRLFDEAKRHSTVLETVPFLMTETSALSEGLLDSFDADTYLLWLTDFDPKTTAFTDRQIEKLRKLKNFIEIAARKGKKIIDVYGSYYSVVLSKTGGISGICNGVLHGESKSKDATVGGGAPPVRYYLRKVHSFLSVLNAINVLKDVNGQTLLDTDCKECLDIIEGKVSNLDRFTDNPYLAQKHFMHARVYEIEYVYENSLEDIIVDMEQNSTAFSKNFGLQLPEIGAVLNSWVSVLRT